MADDEATASATGAADNVKQPAARQAFSDPTIGSISAATPPNSISAPPSQTTIALPFDRSLAYNGKRSLSSIAIQASLLGFTLALSICLGPTSFYHGYRVWRMFLFLAPLSIFHFLEFWTTARFNPTVVQANSFLLFTNGKAYNIAYAMAVTEILVSSYSEGYGDAYVTIWSRGLGLFLVLLGQVVRSLAMAQAGTNFNHLPQKVRKDGHVLVKSGIYGVLRHPSYFGFFWWAVGTQLLAGNKVCVVGYLLVLWKFFSTRIRVEEASLVEFFGTEYEQYRAKTPIGIPFVR